MSRIAAEREMNTSRPVLWPYDVARSMEVYQARSTHPLSHSLLTLVTYAVALLPRCGTSHGDIKRQEIDILASTAYIDTFN